MQFIHSRSVIKDMIIGEVPVSAGQRLTTILGAANRDPHQFSEPDTLRLDRDEGPVVSFGGGIHHCLGAALARLETQVLIPELLRRFPGAKLAREPQRRPGHTLRGFASLPIALES